MDVVADEGGDEVAVGGGDVELCGVLVDALNKYSGAVSDIGRSRAH